MPRRACAESGMGHERSLRRPDRVSVNTPIPDEIAPARSLLARIEDAAYPRARRRLLLLPRVLRAFGGVDASPGPFFALARLLRLLPPTGLLDLAAGLVRLGLFRS